MVCHKHHPLFSEVVALNYKGTSNLLTHTLAHPPYVGLEVRSLIVVLLVTTALIKTIIPLSKKVSIVFVRRPGHPIEIRSRIKPLALEGKG